MTARVILYSKPDCELCEEASRLLASLRVGFQTRQDPRYAQRVPVVEIDGKIVTEGRVSERALRRALRRGASTL